MGLIESAAMAQDHFQHLQGQNAERSSHRLAQADLNIDIVSQTFPPMMCRFFSNSGNVTTDSIGVDPGQYNSRRHQLACGHQARTHQLVDVCQHSFLLLLLWLRQQRHIRSL